MLWRALGHVRNGFYIDVGAADPVDLSVTKLFYDHGWHGINLEPQSAYFALLNAARPHDINLQLAAGRKATSQIFHRIDGTGLSTFDVGIAAHHRANGWEVKDETIEVLPLAEICRQHCPHGPIHFMKVDVEGAEGDVLAGADFCHFRPWIVLVEATLPLSSEESHTWESILTSQGYSFVWFDGLNRFYLADEMKDELRRHFQVQPNVFDNFTASPQLAQRAERAEQKLQQVQEQAAQEVKQVREHADKTLREANTVSRQAITSVRQSACAAEAASHHSAKAMQQMQQIAHTLNETIQQTRADLAEQTRRSNEAQHATHVAQHAAQQAKEQVAAMLDSTSWRVTAPLRRVRHMLPGKQLARRIFHRGARLVLRLPGGQRGIQFIRSVAPGPVEWLARRYRVYEQTASIQHQASVSSMATPLAIATDLSLEEARLYRQLITNNPAVAESV